MKINLKIKDTIIIPINFFVAVRTPQELDIFYDGLVKVVKGGKSDKEILLDHMKKHKGIYLLRDTADSIGWNPLAKHYYFWAIENNYIYYENKSKI